MEERRLIINIRGANAAGKTTLARRFLQEPLVDTMIAPDGTKVGFQTCEVAGLKLPVNLLGRYDESKYSGMDTVKSAEACEWAVREALRRGGAHVMFEGFRVSKSYARYAAMRNEIVRTSRVRWLWVFLHAPTELIWERAQARREDGKLVDKKELEAVVRQMDKTRRTVDQLWPGEMLTLDPTKPPEDIYLRLLAEIAVREQGETLGRV